MDIRIVPCNYCDDGWSEDYPPSPTPNGPHYTYAMSTRFDKTMTNALRLDAEKLTALTGEPQYFMVTCDDCGGDGGFYTPEPLPGKWSDPTSGERWDECRTCAGSGWITNYEPAAEIDQDELPPLREDGTIP